MKAKIVRGSGFRGISNYVADPKRAEHVTGTMTSIDAKEMQKEFEAVRALRPMVRKPVWHCSLALPEGEKLDTDKWEKITHDFMSKMGFDEKTPYSAFRHTDTEYDHIHIVACRVNAEGDLWHGRMDVHKAIKATQELEQKYGLTQTKGFDFKNRKEAKTLTKNEIEMAIRTEELPPREQIRQHIDAVLSQPCTTVEFCEKLEALGVSAKPNIASTGRMNGFGFEFNGIAFKGKQIGRNYAWKKLQERGVTYVKDRDSQKLAELKEAGRQPGTVTTQLGDNASITAIDSAGNITVDPDQATSRQLDPDAKLSGTETTTSSVGSGTDLRPDEQAGSSAGNGAEAGRSDKPDQQSTANSPGEDRDNDRDSNYRGIAGVIGAIRHRPISPKPSPRRQQKLSADHSKSDEPRTSNDSENSGSLRNYLLHLDKQIYNYHWKLIEQQAELEDVIAPNQQPFEANDYSQFEKQQLDDLIKEKQVMLKDLKQNSFTLEKEITNQNDLGW